MNLELRTFSIRDAAAEEDELRIANFLRTVEVERIDTAYAEGGWRVMVHFRDLRRREEQAQIESAIQEALNAWRGDVARTQGIGRDEVISNHLLAEVARFAPTTEVELSVIASSLGENTQKHGAAIVAVVRQTMEELTG
ncbi:HRDC domain-containing protein [Niveispirillum sp. KHB5.9]|uniref:HRDC domain-containing protein n=1 Tax=Niveispirillum sp. KHB5.9 TaxID=3400269 RepID=UPI003A87919C